MDLGDEFVGGPPKDLEGYTELAVKIIEDLLDKITKRIPAKTKSASHYHLLKVKTNGSKRVRPINTTLFIEDVDKLQAESETCLRLLDALRKERGTTPSIKKEFEKFIRNDGIDKVCYTIQQSVGIGLDLFVPDNQARKLAGIYFEDLIRKILSRLGIYHKSIQFSIHIKGAPKYRCEIDCIANTKKEVGSTSKHIDPEEVVVSLKTSSKDRMPKIFVDKILLEKFVKHPLKLIAIFHNDIQRQGEDKVSVTFVANLFLVYTKFLEELDGVYFLDPPPHVHKRPWKDKVFTFSKLILEDMWKL